MSISAEELVVKVRVDSGQAEKKLDKIEGIKENLEKPSQINIDSESVDETRKRISALQSQFKGVGESINKTAKATADSGKAFKEASKGSKNLSQAWKEMIKAFTLVEIAKKAARAISQALKEGLKTVYEYSKAMGGAFGNSMDRLSSKTFALKNALGSATANLMQGLEQYLTPLLEWLTTIINKASKLIAEMFGLPTYLEANTDVMKEWQENNKETAKLLGSFDTLNVFGDKDNNLSGLFTEKKTGTTAFGTAGASIKESIDSIIGSFKDIFSDPEFAALGQATGNLFTDVALMIAAAFKTLANIVGSESFKRFMIIIKDIAEMAIKQGDLLVSFVKDLFSLVNGDMSWNEFASEMKDKFIEAFISPIKSLMLDLQIWWYKLLDDILVKAHNVINPNNQINHSGIYDDYQRAYMAKYGTYADGWTPPRMESQTNIGADSANSKNLINMLRASGYDDAQIRSIIMETEGITADELKRKYGLATGGVIRKPSLRLVGEYANAASNPEIVTPQKLLDQRLAANNSELISAYSQMTRQMINAIENVDMTVKVGDQTIARSTARGGSAYYKLTGVSV